MKYRNVLKKFLLGAGTAGASAGAMAAAIDMTPLTSVVDITTIIAAIGTVAALKFAVPFTKWAYRQVQSLFGR